MAGLSAPASYIPQGRPNPLRVDWPLAAASFVLLMFGLMSLYSVAQGFQGLFFKKQLLNIGIGLIPFVACVAIHPNVWRRGANWLYAGNVLLLTATLFIGTRQMGAERWIKLPGGFEFQPSEFAKLFVILTLAAFYANHQDQIRGFWVFALGFLHVAIPAFLIWKQPHLGAALVVVAMWFGVSLVAGVRLRFLAGFALFAVVLAAIGFSNPTIRSHLLTSYQGKRVTGLAKAHSATGKDVRKDNWQTDRAEIAFGVGGVSGSGFMRGEQKAAGFIPEQDNDFIVTVIGEEGGLIGCSLLLAAYGFFFYRIFLILFEATDPFHKMIAAGIFTVLGFHTFVNMAMVLQIVPVVGLWLPFLSYGGTAIWLCMACVGVLLSIRRRQRPILFQ